MKSYHSAILALALMTGCATDAADDTPQADTEESLAGPGGCTQLVQLGTVYFSDQAETNWVGQCTVTCAQWARGAEPFPGQGATCQGTTPTAYHAPFIGTCHVCRF